jgi:calcineurin-like phosphoesterase family protein
MKQNIWFTSDTHFGHHNIIKYCSRPYQSLAEMNESLIRNWNDCVEPHDEVYFLGDLAMGGKSYISQLLPRLNGTKYLVYGNHDTVIRRKSELQVHFKWCKDIATIDISGHTIFMCHYPMLSWYKSNYGAIHLHGHTHGTLTKTNKLRIDVGVDCHDYRPVSLQAVIHAATP